MPVASLDPLSLIKHDRVIATVGALKLLEQRLGGTPESTAAEAGVAHE
jgi:hypothetical protein